MALLSVLPEFIESAAVPELEPVVLPVEFMLLVPMLLVPMLLVPEPVVEFIVPEPDVPVPVVLVALLVPVMPARVVDSAAWTAAKMLTTEKAAAAVVMIAFDAFMMDLLNVMSDVGMPDGTTRLD